MEQLQILKYAYHGALEIWSREWDRLQKHPNNEITKHLEKKYSDDLDRIRSLLIAEEQKANSEH